MATRAERRDPADLAGDRTGLGLGQFDVGHDEGDRRIASRADLVAQAGRRPLRRPAGGAAAIPPGGGAGAAAARRPAAGSAGGGRSGSRAGRVRIVQGSAPGRFGRGGSGSMIAAPPSRPPCRRRTRYAATTMPAFERRRLLTAELLSIGTELTVGETRDTNAGELARA